MNDETKELTPTIWHEWREFVHTAFGVMLDDAAVERFKRYHSELSSWNEKINLISVRSPEEILWRHFADSLSGLKLIDAHAGSGGPLRVIDIGTGAGFPGVPIKIARPAWQLTLVESITKKCTFLTALTEALSLEGTRVINDRAENLGQAKGHRESYDIVLSRAVTQLSPNLETALPLIRVGGAALIYKTEKTLADPAELTAVEPAVKMLGARRGGSFTYGLPHEEKKYAVIAFDKITPTPPAYPRRVGVPEKKPL